VAVGSNSASAAGTGARSPLQRENIANYRKKASGLVDKVNFDPEPNS
jgi:hypothetical protein